MIPTLGYRVADHRVKSLERSKLRHKKSMDQVRQNDLMCEKQRNHEVECLTLLQKACSWGALRVMQDKLVTWRDKDTKKAPFCPQPLQPVPTLPSPRHAVSVTPRGPGGVGSGCAPMAVSLPQS